MKEDWGKNFYAYDAQSDMVKKKCDECDAAMKVLQWIMCFLFWMGLLQETVGGIAGIVANNAKRRGTLIILFYVSYQGAQNFTLVAHTADNQSNVT